MIDTFTVIAQLVNFLILIGLMRYFLYDRIVSAMEKRQQELASRWDEVHSLRDEAEGELSAARESKRDLAEQRERLLAEVQQEVEQHRRQLSGQVRQDVEALRQRWTDAIREESDSFLRELRRRASEEICVIASRALADLAGAKLERQMIEHFVADVNRLDDSERDTLVAAIQNGNRVAIIQTSHQLSSELQQEIVQALRAAIHNDLDVQFEQSDDLVCGIALQTNSHKMGWNVRDYFVSLEQQLQKALEEEATPQQPQT